MAEHDQFKEKLDQLVNQFKGTPEFQAIQERSKRTRQMAFTDDA
jgi:hypothetical protein